MFIVTKALAILAVVAVSFATAQESWPQERVTLITHSSPGGGGDVMLRNLGPALENRFGVATVVDNVTGGSGAVALTYMATQAPRDGYTLLSVTPTQLITPLRSPGIPTYQDLTPIARLLMDPTTVYVHQNSPFQTIEEFIEHARANPRSLTVGIGSAGSLDQLVLENFENATGIEVRTVPHEGGGDAVISLLGQHVDAVVGEPGQALTHLQSGTLRMLTVFQEERLEAYPDVPTLSELGYNVVSNKFRGIFGPPDLPAETVAAIEEALQDIYDEEPFLTYYTEASLEPAFLGSEDFIRFLDETNEEIRVFLEGLE